MAKVRFRASMYLDVFIEETKEIGAVETCKTLEEMREEATQYVLTLIEEAHIPDDINNLYIGGVAKYNPSNLLHPLDREI